MSWKPDPKLFAVNAFSLSWEKPYFYCFPPFSIIWRVLRKIRGDKAETILVNPTLADAKLVSYSPSDVYSNSGTIYQFTSTVTWNKNQAPSLSSVKINSSSCVRRYIEEQPAPGAAKEIILASQCNSTQQRYQSTYKKWEAFCCEWGIGTFLVTISDVIAFLTNMFEMGLG